jgi:hypothetical protein
MRVPPLKKRYTAVFLALLLLSGLAQIGHAEQQPSAAAHELAPLSPLEFKAVVDEALARRRAAPQPQKKPAWPTLDRAKLRRMLQMPEFATLARDAKSDLLDQAGAWELMPFESPSQAQALWARWFPDRGLHTG